ncbi:MAG: MBL fold metallo-hydrolase [Chloroflexi bacterium]|nr:MAG: MBL fold metallo-hydrolase [Chloroflexota bacterium]
MENYLCITCGTQYPESETPPARCPICEDERQYVSPGGQQWATLAALRGHHANTFSTIAPGITTISTEPRVGIGERAHLLQTPGGNVLWDCIAYLDEPTVGELQARGGVSAIAISHPHFFTTMIEWSRALGNVPIHLHSANRAWVMRPDDAIHYWEGDDTLELLPGVTLLRCGGHFPGSSVLHWRDAQNGDNGTGALFTGDTISVAADPRWVTFMYSYPNSIPLDERAVRRIAGMVDSLPFTTLYDGWSVSQGDAKEAVRRSAERYISHLRGETA